LILFPTAQNKLILFVVGFRGKVDIYCRIWETRESILVQMGFR